MWTKSEKAGTAQPMLNKQLHGNKPKTKILKLKTLNLLLFVFSKTEYKIFNSPSNLRQHYCGHGLYSGLEISGEQTYRLDRKLMK